MSFNNVVRKGLYCKNIRLQMLNVEFRKHTTFLGDNNRLVDLGRFAWWIGYILAYFFSNDFFQKYGQPSNSFYNEKENV